MAETQRAAPTLAVSDGDDVVLVRLHRKAVEHAHMLARKAGCKGLTDRQAVEAAIRVLVAELRQSAALADAQTGGKH